MNSTTETTLRFTGDWHVALVLAVAVALSVLMWFLYKRELRYIGGPLARVPAALRSIAVFILVLALSSPVLRHVTTQRQLGRVVLAVDASASMSLTDASNPAGSSAPAEAGAAPQQASRYQRAQDLLMSGPQPLLRRLIETQDVELVLLRGQQAQRLWWHRQGGRDVSGEMPTSLALRPDSPLTNLDQALRDALGPATANSALVVFSDGQHNTGGSPEELASSLRSAGTRIFTVGFGAEVPPADLAIVDTVVPESVFLEETLQGRAILNDTMPAGTPASVRVESGGQTLWQQNFTTEGKGARRFDFSFPVKNLPAAAPGGRDKTLRLLTVHVAAHGDRAANEETRSNNAREVAVHLLAKKRKILIIDGRPRWETRYIHNHFDRDERWQANLILDDYGNPGSIIDTFPQTLEELLTYDLVLLGDVAASRFKPEHLNWLVEFVEKRGGGIVFLDGARGHLKSWAQGRTEALLPVSWSSDKLAATGWSVSLTPAGGQEGALRLSDSPSANATLWPTLPPLRWIAPTRPAPGASVLAELRPTNGGNGPAWPAFVQRNIGAGSVLYVASDESWRWRYQVADLYHQRLWMQIGSWVAAPPFQAEDQRAALGTDRLRYAAGEAAEIRVRLRDANGKFVTTAQPRAYVMHEGKQVASLLLEPDPTHAGVYRAVTQPLKAGAYEIGISEAPTPSAGDLRLSIRVADTGASEWSVLTMNRPLLETMALNSEGRFLREEQAATELPNLLQTLDQKQTLTKETVLWSTWWWFAAVMGLLAAEWLLRRRLKLV